MLLAVRQAPPAVVEAVATETGNASPEVYAVRNIMIEGLERDLRTGATGTRELEIKGHIKNTGNKTVGSAALRCYFKTYSDAETFLDVPLIMATRLEDMDCGPLRPLSGRQFDVRFGIFPDNLQSEIERYELVNVTFLAL